MPANLSQQSLLGRGQDFWLINCGLGFPLLVLAFLEYCQPNQWSNLFFCWTIFFSLPHQSATMLRLIADKHCRERFPHLLSTVPCFLFLASLFLVWRGFLPQLATIWLFWQIWHVTAQNYGIMRRYERLANLNSNSASSRLAVALNFVFPFAAVLHSLQLSTPAKLFWYDLVPLPQSLLGALSIAGLSASLVLGVLYLLCEYRDYALSGFMSKRPLVLASIVTVHSIACFLIVQLSWAYVAISIWHCLQYLAYCESYRRRPPPFLQVARMSFAQQVLGIIGISIVIRSCFLISEMFLPSLLAVLQFTLAFHHYLADSMIWRSPRSKVPS